MDERRWPVTFSIGVAVFAEPAADVEAMVQHADRLMYDVKGSGKNGTKVERVPRSSPG